MTPSTLFYVSLGDGSQDPAPKCPFGLMGVSSDHILWLLLLHVCGESEAPVPALSAPPVWPQSHPESGPQEDRA